MKRIVAVVVGALVAGCGALSPPLADGGTGGGGSTGGGGGTTGGGGGTTGGGGGTTGGGGGITGGGGGTTGGGGGTTGGGGGTTGGGGGTTGGGGGSTDGGVWEFSSISMISAGSLSGTIVGMGEAGGSVWAMSSRGRLFRSTGAAFNEVLTVVNGVNTLQPIDFEMTPSGRMFVIANGAFGTCGGACDQLANWSFSSVSTSGQSLSTLCVVSDTDVLLIGNRGSANEGIAYRWNGAQISTGATTIGADNAVSCWRGEAGDLFIPAQNAVVRYWPGDESFTPEATAATYWRGGGSAMGAEFVTATGPIIARRAAGGTWTSEYTMSVTGSLNAVVGVSATEAFAFGGGPNSSGQAGHRFRNGSWAAMNPDLPVMNIAKSAFLAGDGRLYAGGENANNEVCVVRGTLR